MAKKLRTDAKEFDRTIETRKNAKQWTETKARKKCCICGKKAKFELRFADEKNNVYKCGRC